MLRSIASGLVKRLRCFLVLISSASDVPPDQAVLMAEARELFLGDDLSRSDVMSGQNQTFHISWSLQGSVKYGHFSFFHVFPGLFRHIPSAFTSIVHPRISRWEAIVHPRPLGGWQGLCFLKVASNHFLEMKPWNHWRLSHPNQSPRSIPISFLKTYEDSSGVSTSFLGVSWIYLPGMCWIYQIPRWLGRFWWGSFSAV